jgi:hypothetical protein
MFDDIFKKQPPPLLKPPTESEAAILQHHIKEMERQRQEYARVMAMQQAQMSEARKPPSPEEAAKKNCFKHANGKDYIIINGIIHGPFVDYEAAVATAIMMMEAIKRPLPSNEAG